jgi:hypothetical protein
MHYADEPENQKAGMNLPRSFLMDFMTQRDCSDKEVNYHTHVVPEGHGYG